MPERSRGLHETLSALLEQLRAESLADELEAELPELERVHSELGRLLRRTEPGPAEPMSPSVANQLRERIRRFEERHPDLTLLTGRVMDSLSEMGL